jgi:uncharacterized Fe-S cluster-containing protein
MARFRQTRKLGDAEMKAVGMIVGYQMGFVMEQLPDGSCSPEIRDRLQRKL